MPKRGRSVSKNPVPKAFSSTAEIDLAIQKLKRRIGQVNDLATSGAAFDSAEKEAAQSAMRETILEVFGPDSPEFREYGYHMIWKGSMGVNMHPSAIEKAYLEGIPHTVGILNGLVRRLEEKREDLLPPAQGASQRPESPRRVFIGHGQSTEWRKLKDLLVDRLGVDYEEFNRQSAAGLSTSQRLQDMLENSGFAFLVLTAEDEHQDGTAHARENVIHEAGLFQGRHGFHRTIILLEDDCAEFSNILGLTHIRFPKGDLLATSEQIRQVLERECVL